MRAPFVLAVVSLALFAGEGRLFAEEGGLLAEEDRRQVPEVTARCAELSKRIERLLGPKFKRPVPVYVVTEDFIARFAQESEERLVPKQVRDVAQKLAVRLKHVPAGFDVMAAQIRLLRKMVAGLYDPDKNCYYVVDGKGEPGGMTFDVTAAHEIGHAYRDVDKDYWKRVKATFLSDEDYAIAVTCLVEGDAELIGQSVGIAASTGRAAEQIVSSVVTSAKFAARGTAAAAANPMMRDFPLMLREMLVTRYLIGQTFAASIYEKGGWAALDRAFDAPPRSTEQVLHPEKYLGPEVDEPTRFSGGDPSAALGEGWTTIYTNTAGEFLLRVHLTELLGRRRATRVAAGWDGARYHLCEREGQPLFFGVMSTWDTEEDAEEFARAWADWASLRDDKEKPREVVVAAPDRRVQTKQGLVIVRRAGRDVVVLDGIALERSEAVVKALLSAKREA